MSLSGCKIGFAITGSFCTFDKVKKTVEELVKSQAEVYPIFSANTANCNTRFGKAEDFIKAIEKTTGKTGMYTISDVEPIGPSGYLDALVISPCTGNTIAKLCNGITDTAVLMAAKAHLRNNKPLIISISTNDALGMNLKNIGMLMNMKNIFFVPFGQDNFEKKPNSMIADLTKVGDTIEMALKGKQLQPVIIPK